MRIDGYTATTPTTGKPVKIDYWWDRSIRLWTIVARDADDNQIGDATYEPRRSEMLDEVARRQAEIA